LEEDQVVCKRPYGRTFARKKIKRGIRFVLRWLTEIWLR